MSGVPVISSLSSLSITNNTSCGPNSAHFLRPWSLGTQLETSCSSSLGRQGKSGDGELGTNNGHTPHRDKRGILILSSTWLFLARILLMEALFANSRNGSLQLTNLPAVAQAKKPCSRHVFPYQNYNYNNFSPPEHVKSWGWSGRPKRFASSSKKPFLEVLRFSSYLLHKVTNAPWGPFLVVIIETYVSILWLNVQRFSTLLTYKGLNKCLTFLSLSNAFSITVYMLFNNKCPNYWVKQQKMNRTIYLHDVYIPYCDLHTGFSVYLTEKLQMQEIWEYM